MSDAIERSTDCLPKMVREAMDRVEKGATYLSEADRRILDNYDGPVVVGDPPVKARNLSGQ